MNESLREHLLATIAHLGTKRSHLLIQLQEVEDVLKSLRREEESLPRTPRIVFPEPSSNGQYSKISVRWSVLWFLADHVEGPQPLGVIADALREGGSASKAQSFNSNVSAVMSQMVGKDELAKTDDGFSLTDHGRVVWHGIKNSEKFINRDNHEASRQPELLGYETE